MLLTLLVGSPEFGETGRQILVYNKANGLDKTCLLEVFNSCKLILEALKKFGEIK